MTDETKYVKDSHGHVYIYVAQYHGDRIGKGIEFIDPPQPPAKEKIAVNRSYRTLQELREAAAKSGFDIADGTPFAKAQNMYADFLKRRSAAVVNDDLSGIGAFDNAGKTTN